MGSSRDRQVVDAVLAGDVDAYRILVERETQAVVGLCLSILRDPDEAQDVAQDAFVQAYRSLAGYRGDGTFGAWIGRIAARVAVSRAVSRRQRPVEPESLAHSAIDGGADPEREVVRIEHARALRDAIGRLPADQRTVVAMRYFGDMQIDQIAEATGTPAGTVKSRLHRGLARLRHEDLRQLP